MKNLKQTIKSIKNSLDNWDYEKAIVNSNDETTTRAFLIHPFFDLLNYDQIDDYTHEYIADLGSKRADIFLNQLKILFGIVMVVSAYNVAPMKV